jgi:hypothetical protein
LLGILADWLTHGVYIGVVFALLHWAFGWTPACLRKTRWNWSGLRGTLPDLTTLTLYSIAIIWAYLIVESRLYLFAFPDNDASFAIPLVNAYIPWLAELAKNLEAGMDRLLSLATLFSIGVIIHRRWPWAIWSYVFLSPFYEALSQETVREYFLASAQGLMNWIVLLFLVCRIWRFDAALIFVVYTLNGIIKSCMLYWTKGGPAYQSQMWPLIIAGVIIFYLCCVFRTKEEGPPPEDSARGSP